MKKGINSHHQIRNTGTARTTADKIIHQKGVQTNFLGTSSQKKRSLAFMKNPLNYVYAIYSSDFTIKKRKNIIHFQREN